MTQEELKSRIFYDPKTGVMTWKSVSPFSGVKVGQICGCINNHGYRILTFRKKIYSAHRLAWLYVYGELPKLHIDHLNGDKDDNRIVNLRLANPSDNSKNQALRKTNLFGIHGVRRSNGAFDVQIGVKGRTLHLGRTKDFFEACCRRKSAEYKYGFHKNHGCR